VGKKERVFLVVILYTPAIACTNKSMAVRDGAIKGAGQPAHFLVFSPVQLFLMKWGWEDWSVTYVNV